MQDDELFPNFSDDVGGLDFITAWEEFIDHPNSWDAGDEACTVIWFTIQ